MTQSKNKNNPCIKHKLWGELKAKAKHAYKIFPVEGRNLWLIKYWSEYYGIYDDLACRVDDYYKSIEEAQKKLEELRTDRFYFLCEKELYERKRKRVEKL